MSTSPIHRSIACIVQSSPVSTASPPAMASATGIRAAAAAAAAATLLFSFSAVVLLLLLLLLQAPRPGLLAADLVVSALDRFVDDGRGLLELLATRRNMILLCHAILLLILRDAGVLGAPAACRSPPAIAVGGVSAAVVAQTAAPARPRRHATRSAVVWRRRPRNRANVAVVVVAPVGRVVNVERRPAVEAAWAAPVLLTTGPPPPPPQAEEAATAVATKQMVVVESPRNENDDDDRASVVEPLEHPTAIAAPGEGGDCDDRRIIAVAADDEKRVDDTAREHETTAEMEMEMEMELADDRTFEEFIKRQRRKMRQESLQLQLVRSGQATTTRP
ncbi:hypothetical protein SORBI_3001G339300 [Sorghum bicolor]|uniref:Uncharacterized protein n=1 Tax=Sorghum bicolor TaxID=4558 RepID=C5WWL8_SORBI|nr:hypothetical protein SORBI_3001G339300 [Sorghum bicolor]